MATLAALAALAGVAGCSSGGDSGSAATTTTAKVTTTDPRSTTTRGGTDGPDRPGGDCPGSDDVAEVIGGAVHRTPTGGTSFSSDSNGKAVSYSYQGCDYEVTEGPDGDITVAHITSSEIDGQAGPTGSELFDALATAAQAEAADDGFEPLTGIGDEAYRDGDRIVARTAAGVLVVSVDGADGDPDQKATEALARAMARRSPALTVAQFDGAGACPDIDDAVGQALDSPVSGNGPSGGTSGVGDATLDWSGCHFDLEGDGEAQVGMGKADEWDAWVAAKLDSPFTSFYDEVTVGELSGFDDGEKLVIDTGDDPLLVETSGGDLGPDQATLRVDLARLALGG